MLTGVELIARAAVQRKRAAQLRAKAAEHRVLAAADRQAAARDRELAARERQKALADRQALASALGRAAVDALTGARTRAAGLGELDRELDRARRTSTPLVVAYVDGVGLKAINDTKGHGAGDALLRNVVAGIKAQLRPYDLIIRLGGDEFLCAMSNLTLAAARERFTAVISTISQPPDPGAIRVGFAQLRVHESAAELIARADAELIGKATDSGCDDRIRARGIVALAVAHELVRSAGVFWLRKGVRARPRIPSLGRASHRRGE
jgi:diguanylate cyclase (GGDEF)-like protein